MFQIRKASRRAAKIKLALAGCSGAGKTFSALQLAKGIVGDMTKVCVLDTENRSSDLYASEGDFAVVDFKPPYSPERYLEAISFVENHGFELLIIDSISPEWDGEGGCLEIHEKAGGRFQDWAKVTPLHRKLFDTIRRSPMHIICTMRKKTDYALDQSTGKPKAIKVGLKDVQRDGADYEFDVVLDVDHAHYCTASKDRTNIFARVPPFIINPDTGKQLVAWANAGEEPDWSAQSRDGTQAGSTVEGVAAAALDKGAGRVVTADGAVFSSQDTNHRLLLRSVVEELGVGQDWDTEKRKALVQFLTSQNVRAERQALANALRDYVKAS